MTELKSEMNDGSAGNPATNDVSFEARKPMTAVASSLLMPGLGHLYNGNIVMALAWAVTSSVAGLLSLWLFVAQQIGTAWADRFLVGTIRESQVFPNSKCH